MSVNLFTTCSILTIGCPVYTNESRTTPASNGVYYDGTTCWTITGGIIDGTTSCTTTTTTTAAPSTYDVYQSCPTPSAYYYVYHNPSNTFHATIYANTTECSEKIATNQTLAWITSNYPTATGVWPFDSDNCACV
jgi:hypothetical protein